MPTPCRNELVGILADIDQIIESARAIVEAPGDSDIQKEALVYLEQMQRSQRAVEAHLNGGTSAS
jgi:hypothetical protein